MYDFTLVYAGPKGFQQAPSMAHILGTPRLSPKYHFHVHVKRWASIFSQSQKYTTLLSQADILAHPLNTCRYMLADLPQDEEALSEWALQRFVEKDEYLKTAKDLWENTKKLQS